MSNSKKDFIYGIRSIIEIIRAGKTIDKLFIQRGLNNDLFTELWKLVRTKRINYKHVPIERINRITKKNHQGVVAFLSPIDFHKLENVVPEIYERGKTPLILILDSITDVRNFGAIARSAECLQVDAILVPEKNFASINSDAVKTSSGALTKIKVCRSRNLQESIQFLKESGLKIVACSEKGNKKISDFDLTHPVAVVMGSENLGISKNILKICDTSLRINLFGTINSLNVSVATAIILYEIQSQRDE